MRQKKIDLHVLPYTEIAKPGLASPQVIKSVGLGLETDLSPFRVLLLDKGLDVPHIPLPFLIFLKGNPPILLKPLGTIFWLFFLGRFE